MTKEEYKNLLKLARLNCDDSFFEKLNDALVPIEAIGEFDEDIEPMYNITDAETEPSADVPCDGLCNEDALLNSKSKKYGFFEIIKYV